MSEHHFELDDLFDVAGELTETKPERSDIKRAPFSWVGSKAKSIDKLIELLPVRDSWIDHFCGSGIVTLSRVRSKLDVMNDRYSGITAFYRVMKNPELIGKMIDWLYNTVNSREEWQHCADTWDNVNDPLERACKWYYMIYNSVLCKGHSWARATHSQRISFHNVLEHFRPIHQRLIPVQIENLDFRQCFKDYDGVGAVHYFDPPYLLTDQGTYEHKFHREDANGMLRLIANSKGFCALSHYQHELFESFPHWTRVEKWTIHTNCEVKAYHDENHKSHMVNQIKTNRPVECLYIKDC